ncbi:MAG: S9 family peptidase [Pseudomonadales bacterium]
MKPPIAHRQEYTRTVHGVILSDPYHWLRDPAYPEVTDPRVIEYLEAENAYFRHAMAPRQALVEQLFEEIKARQPEEDESVPFRDGMFWYRWRFEKEAQYRQWLRAPVHAPDDWTIILDEPALAAAHDYFVLGGLSVSPSGRYLAWSADTNGSERFTLRIIDLESGDPVDSMIELTLGAPVWAADDEHLFYLKVNDAWRPYQVRRHRLGTAAATDAIVYEEQDESFFVGIDETQSRAFIIISTGDHTTSELRLLPAARPLSEPELMSARHTGHEYHVDHREGLFYILSNDTHRNFRLATAPDTNPHPAHWQTLIPGSDTHYLTDLLCFRNYFFLSERVDGLDQIRVFDHQGMSHYVEFPEEAYDAEFGANAEYDADQLRLTYQSMVTPGTIYDYDLTTRVLSRRKTQRIPSGYEANHYVTHRLHITARDGVDVPVSLVHRKDLQVGPQTPLFLYGYGAYGTSITPGFSASRLSLLNRGFVYAIAHVRGGDDLGYHWYEDGKLDRRTNTFNDFVDVTRGLIDRRITGRGRIAIVGESAGGELVAVAVNQAPELFGAVVAHVPFVDVLNTMLDPTLPLTPIEWPEWGNPIEDAAAFELIRSYSPYEGLQARDYPPMLVTAGLNDPRVTYWEPAKYVARLRELKTDDQILLLKTNMEAGHGGRSGRYDSLRETAEEYAFILSCLRGD